MGRSVCGGPENHQRKCLPSFTDEDDSQSQLAAAPKPSSDPLDTDEPEEPQRPPETTKRCRYCQGATTVVGVLSGNQTLRLQALVRVIVGLFALLPVLAAQLIQELIEQVRSGKPDYRGLPPEIANNLKRQPLVELEPAAFIALLHAQLAPPRIAAEHLTGIPPPSVIQPRQIA